MQWILYLYSIQCSSLNGPGAIGQQLWFDVGKQNNCKWSASVHISCIQLNVVLWTIQKHLNNNFVSTVASNHKCSPSVIILAFNSMFVSATTTTFGAFLLLLYQLMLFRDWWKGIYPFASNPCVFIPVICNPCKFLSLHFLIPAFSSLHTPIPANCSPCVFIPSSSNPCKLLSLEK